MLQTRHMRADLSWAWLYAAAVLAAALTCVVAGEEDFYTLLGVPRGAAVGDIKKAYHKVRVAASVCSSAPAGLRATKRMVNAPGRAHLRVGGTGRALRGVYLLVLL